MSEKVEIVYIGKKSIKKDTVTGSRLVFPQHRSVGVDSDIAAQLLDYPKVWVLASEAKQVIEKQEKHAKALEDAQAKREAEQEALNREQSFNVLVNDDVIDIAKYSSRQLDTLVEAEELVMTIPKKPILPYREAVRDELRKVNGVPGEQE